MNSASHAPVGGRRGHISAITSGKGGVGKTFVSANLAAALARQGEPIPAWIESQGQRYVFQRASQDGPRTKLSRDEVLYEGRLVYVRDGVHVEV